MSQPSHLATLEHGVDEWNRRRAVKEIVRPELGGADLSGRDLNGIDLRLADLQNASLAGASLIGANLFAANLRRADLRYADLRGADFSMAVLIGTDFRAARLQRAKFQESSLAGADFSEAAIGATIFADVELRDAHGLDTTVHSQPSSLGLDTLYSLRNYIPTTFLRNAGLPRSMLEYLPSLISEAIEHYSCFISYSHSDAQFAIKLYDTLQGYGVRCWLDNHDLLPGDNIADAVDRAIRTRDRVLLCCSEASLTSWWVDNEIGMTLGRERESKQRAGTRASVLIPLNLDNFMLSGAWTSSLRQQVPDRLAADFTGWRDDHRFQLGFANLLLALRPGGRRDRSAEDA